jgi:hypothetical protein
MTGHSQLAATAEPIPAVPLEAMPAPLLDPVHSYDRATQDRIHSTWAGLSESERQEYREFVDRQLPWPSQRGRSIIAAAHLARKQ